MSQIETKLVSTQHLIDQYINEYQLRLSKNTLRSYRYSIENFFNNCKKEYDEIVVKDIRMWINNLVQKKNKPTTIETRIYAVKEFFTFCVEDDYIDSNPAVDIPTPKKEDKLPFYLEKEELMKLKEIVKDNVRDKALIETMYATGARVSEIANIKIDDINFQERTLQINLGKGKKDRIVPFTIECGERIKEYLSERTDENPYLFLSNMGNPIKSRNIRDFFVKYSEKLGIKITPHNIRHTTVAHLAMKGMPFYCIQDLLGHEDINTTKIYARLYFDARKLEYDKYI